MPHDKDAEARAARDEARTPEAKKKLLDAFEGDMTSGSMYDSNGQEDVVKRFLDRVTGRKIPVVNKGSLQKSLETPKMKKALRRHVELTQDLEVLIQPIKYDNPTKR